MKKLVKLFIGLSLVLAIFTGFQYFSISKKTPIMMKAERAVISIDKGMPHPPPPTAEDLQKMKAEQAAEEANIRKEKREDLKLYLGFATTIISSLSTIILAIINRKKD